MKGNVFQALLSLELMIAFYNKDYIEVFFREYEIYDFFIVDHFEFVLLRLTILII